MRRNFDLQERLIDFAVMIIKLADELPKSLAGRRIGDQLVRSGTSPALDYGEALGAESQADFVHKMSICLKELRETEVNLKIIDRADILVSSILPIARKEGDDLVAIFNTSVRTARSKLRKK